MCLTTVLLKQMLLVETMFLTTVPLNSLTAALLIVPLRIWALIKVMSLTLMKILLEATVAMEQQKFVAQPLLKFVAQPLLPLK